MYEVKIAKALTNGESRRWTATGFATRRGAERFAVGLAKAGRCDSVDITSGDLVPNTEGIEDLLRAAHAKITAYMKTERCAITLASEEQVEGLFTLMETVSRAIELWDEIQDREETEDEIDD